VKHFAGENFKRGERGRLYSSPGERIGCRIGHIRSLARIS
jgi:hypothetical protein